MTTTMTVEKFCMEEIELDSKDPFEIFKSWYGDAKNHKENSIPERLTLATVKKDGNPTARTVLLRGFDQKGFKMYWDNRSRKTQELEGNRNASIVIVWSFRDAQDNLGSKQVRIEGVLERLPPTEEMMYFEAEPVVAKIRSAVCVQSRVVEDERKAILEASQELLDRVKGGFQISKPDHFSGYRLVPSMIEFYQGTRDTINDRIRFYLKPEAQPEDLTPGMSFGENGWVYERLEP